MRCRCYLAPALESPRRIPEDLREVGLPDCFLHVIANDESGLARQPIRAGNYPETRDVVRDGSSGAAIGAGCRAPPRIRTAT